AAKRHQLATAGWHIKRVERTHVLLPVWPQLHDDLVFVSSAVDAAHLIATIGVIERLLDGRGGDAKRRGLLAIDVDVYLRVVEVEITVGIHHPLDCRHLWQESH